MNKDLIVLLKDIGFTDKHGHPLCYKLTENLSYVFHNISGEHFRLYKHDIDIDILYVSPVFDISNNEISKNIQKLEKLFPSYFRKLKINKLLNV